MRSIVVGVDESPIAAEALRWAVQERRIHDGELTCVLCWSYLDQHQPEPAAFDAEYGDEAAARTLEAILAKVLDGDNTEGIARRTVNDLPARGLLELSADADLLVVGARGLGGFRQMLLGSVSRQILHHATVPVAIVHEPRQDIASGARHRPAGRVVVGVDGSPTSQRALAWAIDEARARKAEVVAVHAWMPPTVGGVLAPVAAYDATSHERTARAMLEAAVENSNAGEVGVAVNQVVECGDPVTHILEAADGADLVVVGSRGLGGFKGLLLGSVSHGVTHHATCPVVVIPHAE